MRVLRSVLILGLSVVMCSACGGYSDGDNNTVDSDISSTGDTSDISVAEDCIDQCLELMGISDCGGDLDCESDFLAACDEDCYGN